MSETISQHRQSHYWIAGRGIVLPIRIEVEQEPTDGDSVAEAIEDYRSALPAYRDVLQRLTLSTGLDETLTWLNRHLGAPSSPASPQSR